MKRAEDADGRVLEVVSYPYGAAEMREVVHQGADGLWWTIPQTPTSPLVPQPSPRWRVTRAARTHSELHSVVLASRHR